MSPSWTSTRRATPRPGATTSPTRSTWPSRADRASVRDRIAVRAGLTAHRQAQPQALHIDLELAVRRAGVRGVRAEQLQPWGVPLRQSPRGRMELPAVGAVVRAVGPAGDQGLRGAVARDVPEAGRDLGIGWGGAPDSEAGVDRRGPEHGRRV